MTPSGGKPGVKVGESAGATQEGVELTLRLRAHGPRERLPERAIESLFGEAGEDRIAPAQPLFEEYGPEIARKASEERDTVISFFFTGLRCCFGAPGGATCLEKRGEDTDAAL